MVLRRLVKDSAIYGGADLITKVLAFFTFPLVAAALSPRVFGVLELIVTSTVLLGMFSQCGLNNALCRFYWDKDTHETHRAVVVSSGLAAQVLFGSLAVLCGLIVVFFLYPHIQDQGLPLTWVALLSALLLMAFRQWSQYALDVTRMHFAPWRFMAISLVTRVGSTFLGMFVVVFWGWGVDGLLAAQALMMLVALPLAFLLIRKDLTVRIDRNWFSELVRFGYPFIFAGLAYWVFGYMDRWMLAYYSTVEEVGIYSVAFRFASLVVFVSAAFGQAWSPVAIKIRTDRPDEYRSVYAKVLLLLLFVMLVVGGGLALFSGELIGLIMPREYASSALPLSILCFGIVLQATQQITAIGISLEKKTFLFARLAWATALVNLVLNLLLIPRYGASGASWATTISYLVLTGSYLFFTQRLHPLPLPWRRLGCLFFLGSCVAFAAIRYNATSLNWSDASLKLGLALLCLLLGWFALPIRSLRLEA